MSFKRGMDLGKKIGRKGGSKKRMIKEGRNGTRREGEVEEF